jgi:hypothetical protein
LGDNGSGVKRFLDSFADAFVQKFGRLIGHRGDDVHEQARAFAAPPPIIV